MAAGGVYQQRFCSDVDFRATAALQNAACILPVVALAARDAVDGHRSVESRGRGRRGGAAERGAVHDVVRPRHQRVRRGGGGDAVRGDPGRRGSAVLGDARSAPRYRDRRRPGRRAARVLAQRQGVHASSVRTIQVGDGRRQHRVDPVHDPAVTGQQRAHVLDAEVALDLGLDQVAERAGDHQHQAERHADPRGLVEQERHGQHGGGDAEQQRTGETLPRFLRADRGHHRVLAEQHPGA